jgi:hypothetical protein
VVPASGLAARHCYQLKIRQLNGLTKMDWENGTCFMAAAAVFGVLFQEMAPW